MVENLVSNQKKIKILVTKDDILNPIVSPGFLVSIYLQDFTLK